MRTKPYPAYATSAALFLLLSTQAYGASMNKPDIKLNPNPRMRYEITATVTGAPGDFERVAGHVDYKVVNDNCVPLTPVTGARVFPEKSLPITYERLDGNTFKGVIYVDQFQDEDYFGLGVCHWSVVGATVDFHHGEVNFSPAIFHDDIVGQERIVRYFSEKSYQHSDDARIDTGSPNQATYSGSTFTITLQSVERVK